MKFKPQSEDELNSFKLLDNGEYDFTVIHAENKVSRAGNEYIFLKLQVWDKDGKERLIFTNLALIKLLKHFCDVTGLQYKYNLGEIYAEDCLNKIGLCQIGYEQGSQKPEGGYYPDKNVVIDYIVKTQKKNIANKDDFHDDDIPF